MYIKESTYNIVFYEHIFRVVKAKGQQWSTEELKSYNFKDHACRPRIRLLGDNMSEYQISLCWTPGHCEFIGNEMAEKLIRYGAALE